MSVQGQDTMIILICHGWLDSLHPDTQLEGHKPGFKPRLSDLSSTLDLTLMSMLFPDFLIFQNALNCW